MYVCTHIYLYTHECMYVYIYIYTHPKRKGPPIRKYIRVKRDGCVVKRDMHSCEKNSFHDTYVSFHMCKFPYRWSVPFRPLFTQMHVYIFICIYTHTHEKEKTMDI